MRTLVLTLASLVIGFFAGIILSQVIGMLGFVLLQRPVGIPYLSLITAVLFAAAVLLIDTLRPRRSR